jgi:hypothetical protein
MMVIVLCLLNFIGSQILARRTPEAANVMILQVLAATTT